VVPGGVYLAADGRADERDDHAAAHPRDEGQLPGAQQGARTSLPEQQGTGPPTPPSHTPDMKLCAYVQKNRP
jgi:hypothetical protein